MAVVGAALVGAKGGNRWCGSRWCDWLYKHWTHAMLEKNGGKSLWLYMSSVVGFHVKKAVLFVAS